MHENRSAPCRYNADRINDQATLCDLGLAVTPVFSSDLGRHLLSELRELLGLRGHRLELLACMRGRQLYEL